MSSLVLRMVIPEPDIVFVCLLSVCLVLLVISVMSKLFKN